MNVFQKHFINFIFAFFLTTTAFITLRTNIYADSCEGVIKCSYYDNTAKTCYEDGTYYTRNGCGFDSFANCGVVANNCDVQSCFIGDTCHVVASAGCLSGSCYYGIAACSTFSLDPGLGSCDGGICCISPTSTPTPAPGSTPAPTSAPHVCNCGSSTGTVCGEGDCNCPDKRITTTCRWSDTGALCGTGVTYSCTNSCQLTDIQNADIKWHRSTPSSNVDLAWDVIGCLRDVYWRVGYDINGSLTNCTDWGDPDCIEGSYNSNDYSCDAEMFPSLSRDNFLPNTLYRFRVRGEVPKYGDTCTQEDSVRSVSSCDLPDMAMNVGESKPLISALNCATTGIYRVRFVVENGYPGKISFTDFPSDADGQKNIFDCPYTINLTANKEGLVAVTAYVDLYDDGADVYDCSDTATITIIIPAADAWWQVKDADVITRGQLLTKVLSTYKFDLAGSGGYPGVPWFGTTDLTNTTVSDTGWLAQSYYSSGKTFNSSYFFNALPSDTEVNTVSVYEVDGSTLNTGGIMDPSGYYYYEYDGNNFGGQPLNINSNVSLGTRKVVLFVKNAGVNIKAPINLDDAAGFFMIVASGDISIDPIVGAEAISPDLEGVYVADGNFNTGTGGAGADNKLYLRGTVVSGAGVSLQRDRGDDNDTEPSELIEFAADQEILFPKDLSFRPMKWQEVAP